MVWGSFLIAAAALKTPTRNGYNAQGVNLTFCVLAIYGRDTGPAAARRLRDALLPSPCAVVVCMIMSYECC